MDKSRLIARHTFLWPTMRMRLRIDRPLKRFSVAQRFMLASLAILTLGMLSIGWWVGRQIEAGVIHRTAATTALYMDSFVAPNLQELAHGDSITPQHVTSLSRLLQGTPLGQQIAAFKVWDANGRILYSTEPTGIGRVFPVKGWLAPGVVRWRHGSATCRTRRTPWNGNIRRSCSRSTALYVCMVPTRSSAWPSSIKPWMTSRKKSAPHRAGVGWWSGLRHW